MISGVLAACLAMVATVTPKGEHGRAVAAIQAATPAGQIFGPVLGGVLAAAVGFRATYAILGSVIVLTGFLSWGLLRQDGFNPTRSANPFIGLYRSGRAALFHPLLRRALGILLAGQFAFTIAQGVFAIYVGKTIAAWVEASGVAPAWWNTGVGFTAVAMTVTGLASVLSTAWWGRMHDRGTPFLTPLGASLVAGSLLVLAVWPPWWIVLLARIGTGAGVVGVNTTQLATLSDRVPADARGQLMGLATAVIHLGNLVGFVLGGVLASYWPETGNFALAAGAYLIVAISALCTEMRDRRTTAGRGPQSTGNGSLDSEVADPKGQCDRE